MWLMDMLQKTQGLVKQMVLPDLFINGGEQ